MPETQSGHGHVLITGASTGIGRCCAFFLASNGFTVHAGVRREQDGKCLRADAPAGSCIQPIMIDVTDTESVSAAASELTVRVGEAGLSAVVNNAGVAVLGPVETVPIDQWRRQFEVNVFGQVAVTQATLPLLRRRVASAGKGSARIVFMSSIAGRIAQPIFGPYAASKFAIESLADSLRIELQSQGIFVSLIEPGAIATPIWSKRTSIENADRPLNGLYGATMASATAAVDKVAAAAAPPDIVAAAVYRALTRKVPRTRYFVGFDAKSGAAFRKFIPDRIFDRILSKVYGIPR